MKTDPYGPTTASLPLRTKSQTLRSAIQSEELAFLMEAHDALSALIVERNGFSGIWASGLSISTALGLRDANEASWSQVVDVVERMADSTSIPILVDGDSGFGNFNNVRLLVRKLSHRGAAGICLEDKQFPKMNSFVGDRHPLAGVEEFCGRLRAARDSAGDDDFVVVARIEALIAGHGLQEALDRAHRYGDAGADAILIHSRLSDASEILGFVEAWDNKRPVVIVPTTYYRTPMQRFRSAGVSAVIWGNHNMRAAAAAMQLLCERVRRDESVADVEGEIATLKEIFELLDYAELSSAERTYLPIHPEQDVTEALPLRAGAAD
ncbi:phosphoenolpyruvate mutase [Algihabitans albus]|uniref:phosphoenolpyruvate mutase n=1 Tax=Algihabitans albus TaxID=2164067 RepID=UPI0035CF274A